MQVFTATRHPESIVCQKRTVQTMMFDDVRLLRLTYEGCPKIGTLLRTRESISDTQ